MSPQAALDYQIERYRQMTGEERLAIALDLHELSCDIAREGIRAQHPEAAEAEVEQLLQWRIALAPAVEEFVKASNVASLPRSASATGPCGRSGTQS